MLAPDLRSNHDAIYRVAALSGAGSDNDIRIGGELFPATLISPVLQYFSFLRGCLAMSFPLVVPGIVERGPVLMPGLKGLCHPGIVLKKTPEDIAHSGTSCRLKVCEFFRSTSVELDC